MITTQWDTVRCLIVHGRYYAYVKDQGTQGSEYACEFTDEFLEKKKWKKGIVKAFFEDRKKT